MTLLQGDCLDRMKEIQDGAVDMILCDLPYGVTQNTQDVVIPFPPLWAEYERIVKANGCIALFAQGTFYVDMVVSNRKLFRYDLIWDKVLTTGFLNANRMPLRQHEQIAIFYKQLPVYHPQFTVGEPLHSRGTSYRERAPTDRNYGKYHPNTNTRAGSTQKYPTSILQFEKPHPSVAKHRTEKPVTLLRWLVETYTEPGDTVLDNCMGSGTTGVACAQTGREFIGVEKDATTFAFAKERIEAAFADARCKWPDRALEA